MEMRSLPDHLFLLSWDLKSSVYEITTECLTDLGKLNLTIVVQF